MSYADFAGEVFPAGIGAASSEFEPVRDLLSSPSKKGNGPLYELGFSEFWTVNIDLGRLDNSRADAVEAWMRRRRSGVISGRIPHFARRWPKAHGAAGPVSANRWNTGVWNDSAADLSSAGEVWGAPHFVSADPVTGCVALRWFDPDAVVTAGDPLVFVLDGIEYFCRALQTTTPDSTGYMAALPVEPRLPVLDAGTALVPVTFRDPHMSVRLERGSIEMKRVLRTRLTCRFAATQTPYQETASA